MNRTIFSIGRRKVAVIGVGYVGVSIAYALTVRNIACEIVLIDRDASIAQGEALDIRHGVPFMGASQVYAGSYADCDLIIICAGRNRRPGETRCDLIDQNVGIMNSVVDVLKAHYTHGAILVVANSVDILTKIASDRMGLPNGCVFGSGCILDTLRLTACIASCVCYLADAVLKQWQIIVLVSGPLTGEYGVEGVSLSVSSIVGVNGVERRLEERWSEEEYGRFRIVALHMKECLEGLQNAACLSGHFAA